MTVETDARLMSLLRRQHGVARVRQAHVLGVPDHRIKLLVRSGRLRRLSYGIIAAPGVPENDDFRSMYGALLGGHGATDGIIAGLAGPSSAFRRGLITSRPDRIHVVSTRTLNPVEGFVFHQSGRLPAGEIHLLDGIPTSDAIRSFIDLCHIERWKAAGAFHRGLRDNAFTLEAVLQRIEEESRQGRQGLKLARQIARSATPGAARAKSSWEEEVMRWLVEASFPLPERNVYIQSTFGFDWEIDFLYRHPPTAIDVSPWDTHNDPETYLKDLRKREDLESLGYKVFVIADRADRARFLNSLGRHLGISTP